MSLRHTPANLNIWFMFKQFPTKDVADIFSRCKTKTAQWWVGRRLTLLTHISRKSSFSHKTTPLVVLPSKFKRQRITHIHLCFHISSSIRGSLTYGMLNKIRSTKIWVPSEYHLILLLKHSWNNTPRTMDPIF